MAEMYTAAAIDRLEPRRVLSAVNVAFDGSVETFHHLGYVANDPPSIPNQTHHDANAAAFLDPPGPNTGWYLQPTADPSGGSVDVVGTTDGFGRDLMQDINGNERSYAAQHGNFAFDLIGTPFPGALNQDMETTKDVTYEVTFYVSSNQETPWELNADGRLIVNSDRRLQFYWDGALIDTINAPNMGTWTPHTYNLTATGSKTKIGFLGIATPNSRVRMDGVVAGIPYNNGDPIYGPILDNLSVVASVVANNDSTNILSEDSGASSVSRNVMANDTGGHEIFDAQVTGRVTNSPAVLPAGTILTKNDPSPGYVTWGLQGGEPISDIAESLAVGEFIEDTIQYQVRTVRGWEQTSLGLMNLATGAKDTAVWKVRVTGVNDSPIAHDDDRTTDEDTPISIMVLNNDEDPDTSDTLTVTSAMRTSGLGSISVENNSVVYDPGTSYDHLTIGESATVTFTYAISDGNGGTANAQGTIVVTGLNDPASVSWVPPTVSLPENTDTTNAIKVSDLVLTDPDGGNNVVTISGADEVFFNLVGTELFLLAGEELNFETRPKYTILAEVNDAGIPGTPDDTATFMLNVTDVNEPPTVKLTHKLTSLAESTILNDSIRAARIVVQDDALGSESLSLSGPDADVFEIVPIPGIPGRSELHMKRGTQLDFESKPRYEVAVEVDDPALSGTPDSSEALRINIVDIYEPPEADLLLDGTAVPNGHVVNFGESAVGGSPPLRTFTLVNNGTTDLILQPMIVPSGFQLISPNFSSGQRLKPTEQISFSIQMVTDFAGTQDDFLSFASNDPNESNYRVLLAGAVVLPTHQPVDAGDGRLLIDDGASGFYATGGWNHVADYGFGADAKATVSADGARRAIWAFGDLAPGPFDVSMTWLNGSDRSENIPIVLRDGLGGPELASFTINQRIAPSGVALGGRLFEFLNTVTITGNDLIVELSNEGAMAAVVADAVLIRPLAVPPDTPEITVTSDGSSVNDGSTFSFSATTLDAETSSTFTVRNDGTADLILQQITVNGSAFSVRQPGFGMNQPVAPGSEVTFTVDVDTSVAGAFSGALEFTSNDADESPFNLALAATVRDPDAASVLIDDGDPDFRLTGNWNDVVSYGYGGDAKAITPAIPGTAVWTFNGLAAGDYELSATWLPGSDRATAVPYVIRDGIGAVLATIPVNQKLAPVGSVINGRPFAGLGTVTLNGESLVVEISSSGNNGAVIADAFRIEAVVPVPDAPEISVSVGGITVFDDGSVDVGAAEQGDPPLTTTFTLSNTGTANLILEPVSVTGAGFSLQSDNFTSGQTLAPGSSTSITVSMATGDTGRFTGNVSIPNSDSDESPFNFDVLGVVNAAQAPGVWIIDNGDAGFNSNGNWAYVDGYGFGADALAGNGVNGAATAQWVFDDLSPGDFEVSATWLRGGDREAAVSYVVRDGVGGAILGAVDVDQRLNPGGPLYSGRPFEILNVFTITGNTLVVELSTLGTARAVIADAVRIDAK